MNETTNTAVPSVQKINLGEVEILDNGKLVATWKGCTIEIQESEKVSLETLARGAEFIAAVKDAVVSGAKEINSAITETRIKEALDKADAATNELKAFRRLLREVKEHEPQFKMIRTFVVEKLQDPKNLSSEIEEFASYRDAMDLLFKALKH